MIEVKNLIPIYEIAGTKYTVVANDLKAAIENATNSNPY